MPQIIESTITADRAGPISNIIRARDNNTEWTVTYSHYSGAVAITKSDIASLYHPWNRFPPPSPTIDLVGGGNIFASENYLHCITNATREMYDIAHTIPRGLDRFNIGMSAEQRAVYEKQELEELERKKTASNKAELLLLSLLTSDQKSDYKKNRQFYVQVNGQLFRIDFGKSNNVKKINPATMKAEASFCIHPDLGCPEQDVMIAQKLLLESKPEEFLRIANKYVVN